jgi:hypothetical protein
MTGDSILRNTSKPGFNRTPIAQLDSLISTKRLGRLRNAKWLAQLAPSRPDAGATRRYSQDGTPHHVVAIQERSSCTTLSNPVLVNDPFDFVNVPQAADLNLNARLSSRGDTNSSNAQNSLKQRLLNLHVPDIAVPNLGD